MTSFAAEKQRSAIPLIRTVPGMTMRRTAPCRPFGS
jgi:hypothetical protein